MKGEQTIACPGPEMAAALAFVAFKVAFPKLYDHAQLFDFSLPAGWRGLLWQLSQELQPLGVKVVQVKQKFEQLRVYIERAGAAPNSREQERAHELIAMAEQLATQTCQYCGKPGKQREQYRIECEEHVGKPRWPQEHEQS